MKKRKVKPGDKWLCECGKEHELGMYVAAHWDERLLHTCDCGRVHSLKNGVIELTKLGRRGL